MEKHELEDCDQKMVFCKFCSFLGTCELIKKVHIKKCTKFPIQCPSSCQADKIPRCEMPGHLTKCPLQSVECEFKWAGCQFTSLHKDLQQHNIDDHVKHTSLLAKECCKLQKENSKMKEKLSLVHPKINDDEIPILPVKLYASNELTEFYSEPCGHFVKAQYNYTNRKLLFFIKDIKADEFEAEIVIQYLNETVILSTQQDERCTNCDEVDTEDDEHWLILKFQLETLTPVCINVISILNL